MTSLTQDSGGQVPESMAKYKEFDPVELAQKIILTAKALRESSLRVRETVRIVHESGAIQELAEAIRIAAVASKDTAKEINKSMSELKESGVIKETAAAVEEATLLARQTAKTVNESAREVRGLMPQTFLNLGQPSQQVKGLKTKSAQAT